MYKSALILLLLILCLFSFSFLCKISYAGDLEAQVKLDRLATSKTTGGTICITPVSNGSENSIQIIFPTGMTVNPSASNWTVTTTHLPGNALALPGISTATNVSGQTVTFPSTDLIQGTQYCFNFSGINTLVTPTSTGTFTGSVRTSTSANTTIDIIVYAISIVQNDQINVTATAPAKPSDLFANLKINDPPNGTFGQNTTLYYTFTYGSALKYPTDMIVEVQWDLGTLQGNLDPTEYIVDYDVGSASNAYYGTAPIVDSLNHKIYWVIPSLPPNSADNTLTFRLKVNAPYRGTIPIKFAVTGRVWASGTVSQDSVVTSNYLYRFGTSGQSTNLPRTNPTPQTTPNPELKPTINDIQIRTVSASQAAIFIASSKPVTMQVRYGTNKNLLNQTQTSTNLANNHSINLEGLKSNTRYFFKVILTDVNLNTSTSDLYLLDTALVSVSPSVKNNSLTLSSGDLVLTDLLSTNNKNSTIVLPLRTGYSFRFGVSNYQNIKQVVVILRNLNVLGIENIDISADVEKVTIAELTPGQYFGKLETGITPGTYRLIAQLQDFNGNVTEEPLSVFHIVSPLTIIDEKTSRGIEKAKIIFYYYNNRLKMFDVLPSSLASLKNPSFTDMDGTLDAVLPNGKYRAQVSVLGYHQSTIDFSIGPTSPNYPVVKLKPLPFSLITFVKYTLSAAQDVAAQTQSNIDQFRSSFRFFDLSAFVTITFLVLLLTITTSKRLAVPITHLPYFAFYHLVFLVTKPKHTFIVHGRILATGSEEPIPQALLCIGFKNKKVITHTRTNLYGEFFAKIGESADLLLTLVHKGYKSTSISINKNELNHQITITLPKINRPSGLNAASIKWYTEYVLSTLVEAMLILSLGMEILFSLEFGILKTLPFILVSFVNIILWAVNARASRTG